MVYQETARRHRAARCLHAVVLAANVGLSMAMDLDDPESESLFDPTPAVAGLAAVRAATYSRAGPARRMKTLAECFRRYNDGECEVMFRFRHHELEQLASGLGLPETVRLGGQENWY